MKVFESPAELSAEPAFYAESQYAYLCRSGRPEAAGVRSLVESWVTDYSRSHRPEMIARLQTSDDEHFLAAFFELYVFQLLRHLRHRVTVHPRIGRTLATRPDFVARGPTGDSIVVETVLAYEQSAESRAAQRRIDQGYDVLSRVASPEFFLWIRIVGAPKSPIPARRLRHEVRLFLRSLEYSKVNETMHQGGLDALPTLEFEHDGCLIQVSPMAKSEEARGKPGLRPLGIMGLGEVRWVDNRGPLREAIRRKASRYGPIRRPYVIAVNAVDQDLDKTSIMEALFGQETFVLRQVDGSPSEPEMIRQRNGAWFGPPGPINTRVSAVLVVSSLSPWSASVRCPELYLNPYARHSYSGPLLSLPSHRPVGGHLERAPGREAREVLGLPDAGHLLVQEGYP